MNRIPCSTISEWKSKRTNPSADKIMDICAALEMTPNKLCAINTIVDTSMIHPVMDKLLFAPDKQM